MKLVIGNIQIECNTAEFLQLYPVLMNGHVKPSQIAVKGSKETPKQHKIGVSGYQEIMDTLRENKDKMQRWSFHDLVNLTGYAKPACVNAMKRAIKEGKVKREGGGKGKKIYYSFLSDNKMKSKEKPYTTNGRNSVKMTEEYFNEMLEQVRPLLAMNGGCPQSQIMKMFRKLPASVVEHFLSLAIQKGIIREEPLGTFTMVTQEVQVS